MVRRARDRTGLGGVASRGERARPWTASGGQDREACGGAAPSMAVLWRERERGDVGEGKIWVALLRPLLEKGRFEFMSLPWCATHIFKCVSYLDESYWRQS
jgi:hypothetical protein